MVRTRRNEVTVTEPVTLDDLRWLVEQCQGASGTSRVKVTGGRDLGQRDRDPATITVEADPAAREGQGRAGDADRAAPHVEPAGHLGRGAGA